MEPDKQIHNDLKRIDANITKSLNDIGTSMVEDFRNNMSRVGIRSNTGNLQHSIHVDNIKGSELNIVSDVDYAKYVNDGTSRMPARPFFEPSKQEENDIERIIDAAVTKVFK